MNLTSSAAAALLVLALGACGPTETMVTMQLVDSRPAVAAPDSTYRTYLVEVRSAPLTLFDRVRAGRRGGKPDTIPGIRVAFLPAIVGDTAIMGLWTAGGSGAPAGTFTYHFGSRQVSRGPLPVWMQALAPNSEPALSRDGRYIAYVAVTPDGDQYAVVRDWPAGNSVFQGPAGRRWGYRTRARAAWVGDEAWVSYDASLGPGKVGPVVFVFRGNPGNRMMRVDTYPHHPAMGEPVYAEPDSDTAAETVPEP